MQTLGIDPVVAKDIIAITEDDTMMVWSKDANKWTNIKVSRSCSLIGWIDEE